MTQRLFSPPDEPEAALRLTGESLRRRLPSGPPQEVRIGATRRVPCEQVALLIGPANLDLLDIQLSQHAGA